MDMWKEVGKRRPDDYITSQPPSRPLSENDTVEFITTSFEEHFVLFRSMSIVWRSYVFKPYASTLALELGY